MDYAKLLYGLVVISSHVIFGAKEVNVSQGTHLTSLRESDEWKVSSSLQKPQEFSVPDALKIYDRPRYSSLAAQRELNLLHASEEYQVVAAWLQLTLIPEDTSILSRKEKSLFSRMENSERWKLRGERVERIICMLAQARAVEKSIFEIYKLCFDKTDSKDRCVPGCGNDRRALMPPEFFARKAGSTKVSS